METYYLWGTITRPQGIKGEMKVDTDLDSPAFLSGINCAYLLEENRYRPFPVSALSRRNGQVYLSSPMVSSRNEAEPLRGKALYLDRRNNPLPVNTDLVADLVGSRVVAQETDELIGTLEQVLHFPSQDVYCVRRQEGLYYVPALLNVFPETDPAAKKVFACPKRFWETALLQDES